MMTTHILRWGAPLVFTGVLLVLLGHHSPDAQVFGRYSHLFFILTISTGCLAGITWWIAFDGARYRRALARVLSPRALGLSIILLGSITLLDLFVDCTPAVAWLPLAVALYLALAGRKNNSDASDSRLSEPMASTALIVCALLFTVAVAEAVFRGALVEEYVPSDDDAFARMIASQWPRPVPPQRTPGTLRILHLGDSFGQAGGPRNFQYVLEGIFANAGIPVEVVNFSRPGYEPLEQLVLLQRFAAAYQPDLILHGFFVGNDFATPGTLLLSYEGIILRPVSGIRALRPHNFLLRRWLKRYVVVLRNNLQKSAESDGNKQGNTHPRAGAPADQRPAISGPATADSHTATPSRKTPTGHTGGTASARPQDKAGETLSQAEFLRIERARLGIYAPGAPPAERWRETTRLLAAIRAEARRIGADYMMVIHPDQLQVEPEVIDALKESYPLDLSGHDLELPQRFLMTLCAENNILCVDLLPRFTAEPGPHYLVRDTHYNDNGNRLAAEAIHETLNASGFASPP